MKKYHLFVAPHQQGYVKTESKRTERYSMLTERTNEQVQHCQQTATQRLSKEMKQNIT